jgi:multiple sugar transport system ATP-binding protein
VELSGGQRQRVAIGRALVRDVDVFLFDEPLSNLDAKLRSDLRVEIKRLHQRLKNTMIYVTHDQIEAMTLADKIAIMKGGVIQQLGTPQEIYSRPKNTFVASFVGSPSMNFLPGRISLRDGEAWVELEIGVAVSLAGYGAQTPQGLQDGVEVLVGIRPEQFTLGTGHTGAAIPLVVSLTETLGADNLIWSSSGSKPVCLRVAGTDQSKVGDMIHASFRPADVSVFDARSGRPPLESVSDHVQALHVLAATLQRSQLSSVG